MISSALLAVAADRLLQHQACRRGRAPPGQAFAGGDVQARRNGQVADALRCTRSETAAATSRHRAVRGTVVDAAQQRQRCRPAWPSAWPAAGATGGCHGKLRCHADRSQCADAEVLRQRAVANRQQQKGNRHWRWARSPVAPNRKGCRASLEFQNPGDIVVNRFMAGFGDIRATACRGSSGGDLGVAEDRCIRNHYLAEPSFNRRRRSVRTDHRIVPRENVYMAEWAAVFRLRCRHAAGAQSSLPSGGPRQSQKDSPASGGPDR